MWQSSAFQKGMLEQWKIPTTLRKVFCNFDEHICPESLGMTCFLLCGFCNFFLSSFFRQHYSNGFEEYFHIKKQAPVLYVEGVEPDFVVKGVLVPSVGLGHSADARLERENPFVVLFVELDLLSQMGSRTDKAHIPDKDVVKLRKFVYIEPTHPLAERSDPRIVLHLEKRSVLALVLGTESLFLLFRVDYHGPELVHVERHPVLPYPSTLIEGIVPVLEVNKDRDDQEERRQDDECDQGKNNIEYPLPYPPPWRESDIFYLDDRYFPEKGNLRIDLSRLKGVGDIAVSDPVNTGVLEYLLNLLAHEVALDHEYLIDKVLLQSGHHFLRSSQI